MTHGHTLGDLEGSRTRRGTRLRLRNEESQKEQETEGVMLYLTSFAWAGDPEMGNVCLIQCGISLRLAAGRSALAAPRGMGTPAPHLSRRGTACDALRGRAVCRRRADAQAG